MHRSGLSPDRSLERGINTITPADSSRFGSGILFTAAALLFWSMGPVFLTYLSAHMDSLTQNALRYAVAAIFWLPFLLFDISRKHVDKSLWRKAVFPSLANIASQTCWASVFYYLSPAFVVLISKTTVVWVVVFSIAFFPDDRPLMKSRKFWAGSVLSVLGVLGVILLKNDMKTAVSAYGLALTFGSAFLWALYTILIRINFRETRSNIGFAVVSIYTTVGLVLLAFVFADLSDVPALSGKVWFYLVVSGILGIAMGHVCFYAAVSRIGATIPTVALLSQPFTVLLLSHLVFGETMNAGQVGFGAVLLVGAALAIFSRKGTR